MFMILKIQLFLGKLEIRKSLKLLNLGLKMYIALNRQKQEYAFGIILLVLGRSME